MDRLAILLLIGVAWLSSSAAIAQNDSTDQKIFYGIDWSPEPKGGISELRESTHYPEVAKQQGTAGRVIVEYLIDSTGAVPDGSVEVTYAQFQYGETRDSSIVLRKEQDGFFIVKNSNREIDQCEEVLSFRKLEEPWKSLMREAVRVVRESKWELQNRDGKPVGIGKRHSFPVTFMPTEKSSGQR